MKNLAKSLSKFHDLMGGLEKDGNNPFFKSKYVTLDNILVAIKKPLKEAGLVFVQTPSNLSGQPALCTVLIDIESGEKYEDVTPVILAKQDPQAQGSAITYMRRYALTAMLGLNTETDDDANSASRGVQDETIDMDERFNGAISNDRV
jgi:hypothetical protein